ncbi:MAG TPA: hypothetical protein VNT51_08415 [Miltoncostaeaceae bacterium]|nr:hypothetical protein [Miltoncostaeaceae bacterium]
MDDRTVRAAHWLASGRSSSLVAPAVRLATDPRARDAIDRVRNAGDILSDIDVQRLRDIAERLSDDRDFRRGVSLAASRVQAAAEESRQRRRWWMWLGVLAALAGALAYLGPKFMSRGDGDDPYAVGGTGEHDDGVRPAGSPYSSGAPTG